MARITLQYFFSLLISASRDAFPASSFQRPDARAKLFFLERYLHHCMGQNAQEGGRKRGSGGREGGREGDEGSKEEGGMEEGREGGREGRRGEQCPTLISNVRGVLRALDQTCDHISQW